MKKQKTSGSINSGTLLLRILFLLFFIIITGSNLPLSGQQLKSANLSNALQQEPILRKPIPEILMQIQLVTVPLLVGRNYNPDEISALLNKAGLQLGNAVPVENNEKIGIIISQSPELRQRVRRGTPVDITYGIEVQAVSPGIPENVIVPDYVGMNIDQALGRLPNDRLSPGVFSEISSEQPRGTVLEQFPPPGSNVDPNTSVTLKFSSGLQQVISVDVPRLIGLSLQEAAEELKRNQLFAGLLKEEVSEKREGEVLDQSPSEGTAVAVGSAVNITYSVRVREESEIVPNVIGMDLGNAMNVLDEIGLPTDEVYYENSYAKEGTVIKQRPSPGEQVERGTPVTLIVAQPNYPPPWIYWGGGIVAALLLGGYLGWKSGKVKRERSERKEPEIEVKIIPDAGKQTFHLTQSRQSLEGLHLKIIPDKGVQTLKTN